MDFRKSSVICIIICLLFGCKPKIFILDWDEEVPTHNKGIKATVYRKDNISIRDNFYGIWKGSKEGKELIMYFHKISDIPIGLKNLKTKRFVDAVYGYYIYKENGIEIINSKDETIRNNSPEIVQRTPFYGIPDNQTEIGLLFFKDYGIKIQNDDGTYRPKGAYSSFEIDQQSGKAYFCIRNRSNGVMVRTMKEGVKPEPYNYNFSMPTEWELIKIADEPPPLEH